MKMSEKKSGDFSPCPEFTGRAVCVDVTDPVKVETEYGPKEKFRIVFEVDLEDDTGRRHCVWSSGFTVSLNEKASFRKFLRGWFGRDLTQAERDEFDTEALLGRPAFLVVTHSESDGKTYANIAACTPDRSGAPLAPSGKFIRKKDRKPNDAGSGSGSDYRSLQQPKANAAQVDTAANDEPQDPAMVHGTVKVHVGKCKGLEMRDLSDAQVDSLVQHWLPAAKTNPKPLADDRRLISALEWYVGTKTAAASTVADDVPY